MKYIAKEESERTKLTLPIFLSLYSCNSTKRNDNELTVMKYWINQIRMKIKLQTYKSNIKKTIKSTNTIKQTKNNK